MTPRINVSMSELGELRGRIEHRQLAADDWSLYDELVVDLIGRSAARQARMLAKIAASRGDGASGPIIDATTSKDGGEQKVESSSFDANASMSGDGVKTERKPQDPNDPNRPQGHGRNGADAFTNAKHMFYALAAGVIGALCAACKIGRTFRYRDKVIIRIVGQPMFGAEQHRYEQARCRACGRIVRATGPGHVHEGLGSEYVRYGWSACAMLTVMHYFGGGPFKRLESLHKGWGVPFSDANMWQVVTESDDRLFPLYRAVEKYAIQKATNFRIDDTGSMVIALKRQINEEIAALVQVGKSTNAVRTGINATGLYWETPSGPIILFFTGRHHAGEIVDQLLRQRLVSSPKLVKSTDGASKNFDHEHGDKLIESTCNAHALLKFRDIKDKYPAEYAEAGSIYKQVFDNDDKAKALKLSPVDRMLYHRAHSMPLMDELKKKCEARITSKLVEPNSPLWEPLTFVINQWDRLVRFSEVPDVPLDTNLVEQALIMPVRYLSGSFNYKTVDGAVVGDHLMSLIATARANGVEPVAYLTECLRCHEDLAANPDAYLPWTYRERLKPKAASATAARAPPRERSEREMKPRAG